MTSIPLRPMQENNAGITGIKISWKIKRKICFLKFRCWSSYILNIFNFNPNFQKKNYGAISHPKSWLEKELFCSSTHSVFNVIHIIAVRQELTEKNWFEILKLLPIIRIPLKRFIRRSVNQFDSRLHVVACYDTFRTEKLWYIDINETVSVCSQDAITLIALR